MAFSGAIVLADLNDYIAPSQACIKPVEVKVTKKDVDQPTSIKIDDTGGYYEVTQDGGETKLEKASITLNDCLACSGCITSAESVLVAMQSNEELYNVLKSNQEVLANHRTIVVSLSPQSRASLAAKYNITPLQVARRLTHFFKQLGVHHVFDTSLSRDLSLIESAREFVERYRRHQSVKPPASATPEQTDDGTVVKARRMVGRRAGRNEAVAVADGAGAAVGADLPMLASSCPGWICYAEKTHGYVLPHVSTAKSPQQVMGSIVKDYLAGRWEVRPNQIYHVSIMPCYDKKLEASRPDFYDEECATRDVDCVITTGEVDKMLEEQGANLRIMPEAELDPVFTKMILDATTSQPVLLGTPGTGSGGSLEFILSYAARELFNLPSLRTDLPPDAPTSFPGLTIRTVRNVDLREYTLELPATPDSPAVPVLQFAAAYGFRNIQNLVRKIKQGKCAYHYVEVMACPGGCVNGGGQLKPPEGSDVVSAKEWVAHVERVYRSVEGVSPEENSVVRGLYG
ncbi:cytosolic Fe-S cluster assembly factor narfl-like protein [Jimgerdemannia flammicorona]|uniref:Uncharacterized protein n=2 Tax=Jimgerdemannia flammicorona TaxID=994334 RepID=A0A433QR51_9FUNG|nr:cytosolic Fe-S cluster assembly factor narfl-like protein [Jimgerdemannia flammicorona]RUS32250.1 hypothetical protein BC938DRAFT_475951 [Jimgerdemannia flammicorona]